MSLENSKESRRYIRTQVSIPVILYIKGQANILEGIETVTSNISATGLMIEIGHKLETGQGIKMELRPKGLSNPVHCEGRVIWSIPQAASTYSCGIEFTHIEEDNKNTFLKLLCDMIYKSSSSV